MNLTHDITLEVALANTRKAKTWKNKTMKWSELVGRMSQTVKTPETMAEYKAMTKDQQSEIKDVGAFVGGYCVNGSRTNVRSRSIIALDADFATDSLWEDWLLEFGAAAALYSTHKHTREKPRLRLVVPLSRAVNPDEYQAVGRRIADILGIDQFDDTTYQPQRIMYWPSTSQDGEFVFEHFDADFLDPDTILATYRDWKDISAWPMSSRVADISKRAESKQADPLTKPGLVGAFCRTYSIEDAIEAFIPEYVSCDDGSGRYTYTGGSTAAGVTTYDGKFSYSFHATDPTSGQLCNAWDLVRIFHFGTLDENVDPTKPVTSRPSYQKMVELASEDAPVKAQILHDRTEEARDAFAEPIDDTDWSAGLKINKDGTLASTIENVVLILEHDPKLVARLAYNEMEHSIITVGKLPWREDTGAWTDSDDSALRYYLEKTYGLSGKDKIFDAVNVVAMLRKIHPIRDYLNSCMWDGIPRMETVLIDYLGAEDTPYTRAVTRKTLVAAVARIYNPGCKFDYMLTLRGRQGLGKSALIRKLGGKWYSDSFSTVQGKDAYEQTIGSWIIEVGELAGMKKAEAEVIKLFISKQVDRFRPAYGRRTQEFPRQCIFIGTTNESQFLRDTTGNRRFWIVDTPDEPRADIWESLTPEEVSQIWGEAVQMYSAGEDLFLSRDLEEVARATQAEYEEENPKIGLVMHYLDTPLPDDWDRKDLSDRRQWLEGGTDGTEQRRTVTCIEIWAEALGQNPDRLDRYGVKGITDILNRLPNWRRVRDQFRRIPIYGRQRYYRRVD